MTRTALALLLAAALAPAQGPGPFRIRIEAAREGLTRVSVAAIAKLRPVEGVAPDRLCLTRDGAPVALHVQGGADGRLDPADDLFFFAEAPSREQSKTETYVLSDQGKPWPYRQGEVDREAAATNDDPGRVRVRLTVSDKRVFDPLTTLRAEVLRGPPRPFWWNASVPPAGTAEILFGADLAPMRDAPAELTLDLFGACADAVPQKLRVSVNGVVATDASWDAPFERRLTIPVPGTALRNDVLVRLENATPQPSVLESGDDLGRPRPNRLLLRSASLAYETFLVSPSVTRSQTVAHVLGSGSGRPRRLAIEGRIQGGYQVFDPVAARIWRGRDLVVADREDVPLAIVTAEGAYEPKALALLAPTRAHLEPDAEYVVVTTARLRRTVEPLVRVRAAEGLATLVVEAREIYDAFGAGRATPAAIKAFLAETTARAKKKPKYLLLVGDADLDADFLSEKETLPTNLVRTAYNGATASDALYGDLDGDGIPEIAVGRLPARTPEDLLVMTSRLVAAATAPPPGPWRRRAEFFAGEGRFGPAVDKLIEGVVGALVAKEIPPQFSVAMTYGNPNSAWYWPAAEFNDAVVDAFNRGSALFTYVGHGYAEGLDRVEVAGKRHPILAIKDVARLDAGGRSGLVALIACSTGRFDDPERDCLAEALMARRGGPLAVLAASRISHPFANALLGQGLVKAGFRPGARLGDVVLDAERRMLADAKGPLAMLAKPHLSKAVAIDDLVRDHVHLYHLFGDPAAKLPFAAPAEAFDAPESGPAGATIRLALKTGALGVGTALVTLERPRTALLKSKGGDPSDAAAVKARHAAANAVEVARLEGVVADGAWSGELTLPADLADGDYVLTAYVAGAAGAQDFVATRPFRASSGRAPAPPKDD